MRPPLQLQQFATATPLLAGLCRKLESFQTGIQECFAAVYALPFLRGVQTTASPLSAAGVFVVKHALGRAVTGFVVLDVRRAAGATGTLSIYRRAQDANDKNGFTLYGSASFEALTLWVW